MHYSSNTVKLSQMPPARNACHAGRLGLRECVRQPPIEPECKHPRGHMANAPALGNAPELRAIKWRHFTFATGQTAAAIGYTLDALSPNAPLL